MVIDTSIVITFITAIFAECSGAYVGYKLGNRAWLKQHKQLQEENERKELEKLHLKFENAVKMWGIFEGNYNTSRGTGGNKIESDLYERFTLHYRLDRPKFVSWCKENDIREVIQFIEWINQKSPEYQWVNL